MSSQFLTGHLGITHIWCNWLTHFILLPAGSNHGKLINLLAIHINPQNDPDNPIGCSAAQSQFTSDHLVTLSPPRVAQKDHLLLCSICPAQVAKVEADHTPASYSPRLCMNQRNPEMHCNLAAHILQGLLCILSEHIVIFRMQIKLYGCHNLGHLLQQIR